MGSTVPMRVFFDRCLVETFVNGQTCTAVLRDQDLSHDRIELFSEGGTAVCTSLEIWEIAHAMP